MLSSLQVIKSFHRLLVIGFDQPGLVGRELPSPAVRISAPEETAAFAAFAKALFLFLPLEFSESRLGQREP